MTLNHGNVQHCYNISNLTLSMHRGDQELSNGVNDIKIGPLLTKLESNTFCVIIFFHMMKLTHRCNSGGVLFFYVATSQHHNTS